MKQLLTRFGLPVIVVALLLLAGLPGTAGGTTAASRAVITGTPTEPPTRTPTAVQATVTPTAVATVTPTRTPKPRTTPRIADPAITKSASPSEVRVGDEVTFTIAVTNRGNATAQDVVITDPLADYLDLIEVTASRGAISVSGQTVTVTIGALAPGEEVIIRIRTRVNDRAQPPGGHNGATVTTTSPGDDPSNNTGEVRFTIGAAPTPTATAAPSATAVPPAAQRPRRLPKTGAEDGTPLAALFAATLGLAAIALSLVIRRWSKG